MKRTNLLFSVFTLCFLSSCTPKEIITGKIEGLTNDTLFVTKFNVEDFATVSNDITDTVLADKGRFTFDVKVDKPMIITMFPAQLRKMRRGGSFGISDDACIDLIMQPNDKVRIDAAIDSVTLRHTIKGSDLNRTFSEMEMSVRKEQAESNYLTYEIVYGTSGIDEKVLFERRDEARKRIQDKRMEFVRGNLDNPLSAYYLARMPLDTFVFYHNSLGEGVKNSILKPMIDILATKANAHIKVEQNKKQIVAGAQAPDFTLKNLDGGEFTLSSLRGKYVVVDFWGSWCGWCIEGIPEMKKYYLKYADKLEIVSVACNDTDEKWRKAVDKHALNWINVLNNEYDINEDVAVMYAVEAYPTKVIIDRSGTIVAKFRGESREFYDELDRLFAK